MVVEYGAKKNGGSFIDDQNIVSMYEGGTNLFGLRNMENNLVCKMSGLRCAEIVIQAPLRI